MRISIRQLFETECKIPQIETSAEVTGIFRIQVSPHRIGAFGEELFMETRVCCTDEMPTWFFARTLTPRQAHGISIRALLPCLESFFHTPVLQQSTEVDCRFWGYSKDRQHDRETIRRNTRNEYQKMIRVKIRVHSSCALPQ